MEKFFWEPTREEIVGITTPIFAQHGLSEQDTERLISTFQNNAGIFHCDENRAIDAFVMEFCETSAFTSALMKKMQTSHLLK